MYLYLYLDFLIRSLGETQLGALLLLDALLLPLCSRSNSLHYFVSKMPY